MDIDDPKHKTLQNKWLKEKVVRRMGPAGSNLLDVTLAAIKNALQDPADVRWCGSNEFGFFTWDEFIECAKFDQFYSGFGAPEVATDLVVVGSDWWLERHEYDGSEWWEFKQMPIQPLKHVKPTQLVIREDQIGWRSLADIHDTEE